MPWTTDNLIALEEAIATGANEVVYGDKRVYYRTLKEMFELRQMMRDELGLNGKDPSSTGRKYGSFSKGFK